MLYRVLVDGEDILDYNDPELVLLSPQLEVELDVSGSFEFTVPPNHKKYNNFTPESIMGMTIEVWEDNIMHWFGRPIEYHLDFYKNKKINCEGGLAYFNDSVIRGEEWDETFLSDIFEAVLSEHNSMVPASRQFSMGRFTVNDRPVYRKFNYEQTFDVLKSKFLDAEEGHFFVRRENGTNYIDFLKDMPYTCNQDVEFAENLLNFTYSFDGKDFATCVIPLGANDSETGEPINIKTVNGGSDILVGAAAAVYGNIVKVQQYSDIEHPEELLTEGKKYLTTLQYNAFLIECSAVDLHSKDPEQELFRVGQMVTCISGTHCIQLELPISKMILYLDSAAKQITLGRIPKKTLSRFYKEKVAEGGGSEGVGEDEIPEGWEIIPPDTDDGTPTMRRVPSNIVIHEAPIQIHYNQGDNIDFTGLKIRILTPALDGSGLETYTDDQYPNGIISYPSNELILPVTKVTQQTAQIKVPVQWRCPYTGQLMVNYFTITNDTAAAAEAAHGGLPNRIEAFVTKLGGVDPQVYKPGNRVHLNGVKVYAYWPDGTRYDANGYKDGLIPNTEITYSPKIINDIEPGEISISGVSIGGSPLLVCFQVLSQDGSQWENNYAWVSDFSTPVYCVGVNSGGTIYLVAVSESSFILHNSATNEKGETDADTDHKRTASIYRQDGVSVYMATETWNEGFSQQPLCALIEKDSGKSVSQTAFDFLVDGTDPNKRKIMVGWKRPGDNATLSTYFMVTVRDTNN